MKKPLKREEMMKRTVKYLTKPKTNNSEEGRENSRMAMKYSATLYLADARDYAQKHHEASYAASVAKIREQDTPLKHLSSTHIIYEQSAKNMANLAATNYERAGDAYAGQGKYAKAQKMYTSSANFYSKLNDSTQESKMLEKVKAIGEKISSSKDLESTVAIAGVISLIISIPFLSLRFTGNAVANTTPVGNFAGIFLFIFGIIALIASVKKKSN